jgi:hypothetical protein
MQRFRSLENYACRTFRHERHVSTKLNYIAKTLLGMEQNGFTSDIMIRATPVV